jgi:hypothetical protein
MSSIIKELKKKRNFIDEQNSQIINKLTEDCIKTIKAVNGNGMTKYLYIIPFMIPGFPIYDINRISPYVNNKLKKKGFKTFFTKPNKILVSWDE